MMLYGTAVSRRLDWSSGPPRLADLFLAMAMMMRDAQPEIVEKTLFSMLRGGSDRR